MSDFDVTAVQAIISTVLGTGSGLVTSAIRVAKRFGEVEKNVKTLQGELLETKGMVSWFTSISNSMRQELTGLAASLTELKRQIDNVKARVDESDRRHRASRTDLNQKVKDLNSAVELDLVKLKSDLEDRIDEQVEKSIRIGTDIGALEDLKRRVAELERQKDILAERLSVFVEQESRRWSDLQRTLGRLEGHLKMNNSSTSIPHVGGEKPSGSR